MAYTKNGKTSSDEYEIRFEGRSGKQYRNIDHSMIDRINEAIRKISYNPHIGETMKGKKFHGLRKYRIGGYRMIYEIDKERRVCYIQSIRRRDKAYK